MPQRKKNKKIPKIEGVSKAPGYAYTRKFQELQSLVRNLQLQAEAAKQHVEASRQREMVLLDLTLHQEQIISLFNHQVLIAARQQQHQQPHGPPAGPQHAALSDDDVAQTATASPNMQEQQQQPVEHLQQLHTQLLRQLQLARSQPLLSQPLSQPAAQAQAMPDMLDSEAVQHTADAPQQCLLSSCLQDTPQLLPTQQHEQHLQQSELFWPPASNSYAGSILQAAAADFKQQQRVLSMTAADWSKFFTSSFYKLLLLLELADRGQAAHAQKDMQQAGDSAAGTAAQHSHAGGSSNQPDQQAALSLQQQQQADGSTDVLHPHGTLNSAGASAVTAASAGASCNSPASHMQQLESLVDEWVMLTALALILNPLPVYMATLIDHATQKPCGPPVGHFDRVVRRMRLTKQQVRHFAAVLDEISRLDNVVMAQGGQLAHNAACPSIVVLAAEAERGAEAGKAHKGRSDAAAAAAAMANEDMSGASEFERGSGSSTSAAKPAAEPVTVAGAGAADAPSGAEETQPCGECDGDDNGEADLAPPTAENLLQRNVGRLPLHSVLLMMFNCSTLTRLQLAQCLVASYPFLPMTGQVAASAARLWHQHVAHQKQLQEQQEQEYGLGHAPRCCEDSLDELCCGADDVVSEALHKQQLQVLKERRLALDLQLQQWWQEWDGLGLSTA